MQLRSQAVDLKLHFQSGEWPISRPRISWGLMTELSFGAGFDVFPVWPLMLPAFHGCFGDVPR